MSLLTEASALTSRPGAKCRVAILSASDPQLANEIAEALASSVDASAIGRALRARKHQISDDGLRIHRRGGCTCPRS